MGDEPATRDYFRIAVISAASARPDPVIYGNDPLTAAYPLTWDGPNGVFLAREVDGEILLIAGACRRSRVSRCFEHLHSRNALRR